MVMNKHYSRIPKSSLAIKFQRKVKKNLKHQRQLQRAQTSPAQEAGKENEDKRKTKTT
jgi:hypothetical protein